MKDIKKVSKMDEKLKTNARQVVNHTHKLVLFVLDFNRYKSLKRKKIIFFCLGFKKYQFLRKQSVKPGQPVHLLTAIEMS